MSLTTALEREANLTFNDVPTLENENLPAMPIMCRKVGRHTPATVALDYLAEGAANVVFSIRPSQPGDDPFVFVNALPAEANIMPRDWILGQVLRVSKGLDKTQGGNLIKSDFDIDIAPLFEEVGLAEHLMPLQIASLNREVVTFLNKEIEARSQRGVPIKMHEDRIFGLLMQDMSHVPGESITIEIKPKWLAQSPNAPKHSYRCRNCALQALKRRGTKNITTRRTSIGLFEVPEYQGKDIYDGYICPLQLCSGTHSLIRPFIHHKVLEAFSEPINPRLEQSLVDTITTYFTTGQGHRILNSIKDMQVKYDSDGVMGRLELADEAEDAEDKLDDLNAEYPPSNSRQAAYTEERRQARAHVDALERFDYGLRLAMTLRDCSLYIRADYTLNDMIHKGITIESKLGDLDFKSAEKIPDWLTKEVQLRNGLYYKGTDSESERDFKEECAIAEEFRRTLPHHW